MSETQSFVYKDYLHNFLDTSSKPFLKEIVLFAVFYFFYLNTSGNMLMVFFKYVTLLVLIRYVLSILTPIHNNKSRYFVLNANVMIFGILILLMNQSEILVNEYFAVLLILSYSLLVISTREHYTSDIILTLIVTYSLFNNKLVKDRII